MKIVYSGLESSGKSLKLAMKACEILWRNHKWKEKTGITRPILSNLQFSPDFTFYAQDELGIPIHYWKDLDDLVQYKDVDIFVDEIGTYFDSRLWSELSLDVRRWLSQGAKSGIEMYATSQDFAQVDKAFRRLVNHLYYITKLVGSGRPAATKPPINHIWGLCRVIELDPHAYNEDDDKFAKSSFFNMGFFAIRKKYCEVFDTRQFITKSAPPKLRHVEQYCEYHGIAGHRCMNHVAIKHV